MKPQYTQAQIAAAKAADDQCEIMTPGQMVLALRLGLASRDFEAADVEAACSYLAKAYAACRLGAVPIAVAAAATPAEAN